MLLDKLSLIGVLLLIGSCQLKEPKGVVTVTTPIEISDKELILNQNKGLFLYKEEPFTGKAIQLHPNKNIAKVSNFKLGKREGLLQKFYPDSTLSFECKYFEGKLNGKVKSWWKDGKLRSISNFNNGIAQGLQEEWYKSGAKFKELNLVDGKEKGFQKAWRENGKIYNNYEARDGRIFGLKRSTLCYQLEEEEVKK